MENDMRMLKFDALVEDINVEILRRQWNVEVAIPSSKEDAKNENIPYRNYQMALIFDYWNLNKFGKAVMEHSQTDIYGWNTFFSSTGGIFSGGISNINDKNILVNGNSYAGDNTKVKLEPTKMMIERYRGSDGYTFSYSFIFWALMILAVDKTDYENKLSLICDFARIFKISDAEIMDMVKIIKLVLKGEFDGEFETDSISDIFEYVIAMND